MKQPRSPLRSRRPGARSQDQFVALIGAEVVRFQEESSAFDDVAARVLALERRDLPCMTMLLFAGPASVDQLSIALHARRGAITDTIDRLQLAGYARRRPEDDESSIELTEHARQWIEHIWAPLREEGGRLLRSYSARDLAVMSAFMARRARFRNSRCDG